MGWIRSHDLQPDSARGNDWLDDTELQLSHLTSGGDGGCREDQELLRLWRAAPSSAGGRGTWWSGAGVNLGPEIPWLPLRKIRRQSEPQAGRAESETKHSEASAAAARPPPAPFAGGRRHGAGSHARGTGRLAAGSPRPRRGSPSPALPHLPSRFLQT